MIPKPHLPPSPIGEGKVTVTAIETLQPVDLFPGLLLVRIHTDAGLIGHGKTYNVPVSMHDCTGPLTLFAGLHMGAAGSQLLLPGDGAGADPNRLSGAD